MDDTLSHVNADTINFSITQTDIDTAISLIETPASFKSAVELFNQAAQEARDTLTKTGLILLSEVSPSTAPPAFLAPPADICASASVQTYASPPPLSPDMLEAFLRATSIMSLPNNSPQTLPMPTISLMSASPAF